MTAQPVFSIRSSGDAKVVDEVARWFALGRTGVISVPERKNVILGCG